MPESPREALANRLSAYPSEALAFFKGGFATAAKLSEAVRASILRELIEQFKSGSRRLDETEISAIAGVPKREADAIAGAYTIVIGLLSDSDATTDDFISAAQGQLFSPEEQEVATSIAVSVCAQREEITSTVQATQLAGVVLPSLYSFDVTVDVRFRIEDGSIRTTTPVAVVHIDTDADHQEMWLQLTAGDIEFVIKRLSKAANDMKIAEASVSKLSLSKK